MPNFATHPLVMQHGADPKLVEALANAGIDPNKFAAGPSVLPPGWWQKFLPILLQILQGFLGGAGGTTPPKP